MAGTARRPDIQASLTGCRPGTAGLIPNQPTHPSALQLCRCCRRSPPQDELHLQQTPRGWALVRSQRCLGQLAPTAHQCRAQRHALWRHKLCGDYGACSRIATMRPNRQVAVKARVLDLMHILDLMQPGVSQYSKYSHHTSGK